MLTQLTKAKMELAVADGQAKAVEVKLGVVQKEVEVLQKWHRGHEATDTRNLQHLLNMEKMKVKGEQRRREGAEKEVGSKWEVITSNEKLHAEDAAKWVAEMQSLKARLKEAEAIAEQEAELHAGVKTSGATAEASAETIRKAVARPPVAITAFRHELVAPFFAVLG